MNKIRAPFPWFGGKGNPRIKNAVLNALPPHTKYIEPFGGGASILMAKPPCEVETYNDVNRGVVSFFRVIATLMTYDGAVVLSGYDSPIYAPLAQNGWDKIEIEVCCSAAGRTRNSGLQGEGKVKAKQRRTEVIWRNPEALKRIKICK